MSLGSVSSRKSSHHREETDVSGPPWGRSVPVVRLVRAAESIPDCDWSDRLLQGGIEAWRKLDRAFDPSTPPKPEPGYVQTQNASGRSNGLFFFSFVG
jgi:hypothetical protein